MPGKALKHDLDALGVPLDAVDRDDVGPSYLFEIVADSSHRGWQLQAPEPGPAAADDLLKQVSEREPGIWTARRLTTQQRAKRHLP
jgi:hypothetical protein